MINASFLRSGGRLSGFSVTGHAGYGDEGTDIVCAGVSSAVMLICNAVTVVYGIGADVSIRENEISLRSDGSGDADRLISALQLHLEALSEEYPENISVNISEV